MRACAICGKDYAKDPGWAGGCNPEPLLRTDQRVCEACDNQHVTLARVAMVVPGTLAQPIVMHDGNILVRVDDKWIVAVPKV